jgi:hypothetical protein
LVRDLIDRNLEISQKGYHVVLINWEINCCESSERLSGFVSYVIFLVRHRVKPTLELPVFILQSLEHHADMEEATG